MEASPESFEPALFDAKVEELSIEEIMENFATSGTLSSYRPRELSQESRDTASLWTDYIRNLARQNPEAILRDPVTFLKARLIGANLCDLDGLKAMQFAADLQSSWTGVLSRAWDRVSIFEA
jgi:hypothetical protein